MKLRIGIFIFFVSTFVCAQDGAQLAVVPVTGVAGGGMVVSFDILETEAGNRLVVETRNEDAIVGFYTFDYVESRLVGRISGRATLPVRFREPADVRSVDRAIAGVSHEARYLMVEGESSPVSHQQYVTLLSLAARRFADVRSTEFPELPPPEAGLSITYVIADVNRALISECVLEPNLIRRSERMAAVSADWVLAQGRPYLLLGLVTDAGAEPWPLLYRLYSQSMQLVYQTDIVLLIDPNRPPQPFMVDLTGDGEPEIVVFSSAGAGPPMAVLQTRSGDPAGERILALNDCDSRMNGDDVRDLQRALERRGFAVGRFGIDGWYGPDTRAAVVGFQRTAGLRVTGVVDRTTWSALGIR